MKIGFTGTRYGMNAVQIRNLRTMLANIEVTEAHHGDCRGADEEFHNIVLQFLPKGKFPTIHPPRNPKERAFCSGEILPIQRYLQRNRNIVQSCELLIAAPFELENPGFGGTWWTIEYAKVYPRSLAILFQDGTWTNAEYEYIS